VKISDLKKNGKTSIEFNGSSHARLCDQEFIGKAISYLYRYGQIYIGKKIEPYGIGSGQFPFLMRLYREDGINQESLSDYLKLIRALLQGL